MSKCVNCQYEIPQGSAFCPNCGQTVSLTQKALCPQCRGVINAGAKYCYNCGCALNNACPQPAPSTAAPANSGSAYYTNMTPGPAEAAHKEKRRKDRGRIVAIVGIVLAIVVIGMIAQNALFKQTGESYDALGDAADTSGSSTDDTATVTEEPAALPYPDSGYIFYGWAEDNACPLTVKTEGDQAYFVKLETLSGEDVFAFFIRPGETVDTLVPLGTYTMKYASGVDWYGLQDLFGDETVYTKADDIFDFTYSYGSYNGWTVTLYTVANGNLTTEVIDAGEF